MLRPDAWPASWRTADQGIDPELVRRLHERELARFLRERPRSAELRERARRSMPNGVPMAVPATEADPDRCVEAFGGLLGELTGTSGRR